MGDDLRVGFGDELVALIAKFTLQVEVVLNDAVVDDDDAARAVTMGMGVFLSGASVRGPAGMTDAEGAVQRMLAENLFKVAQFSRSAAHLQSGAGGAAQGDTCRVVSAVFEAAQPLDDYWKYLLRADVPDDSAHWMILCDRAGERMTQRWKRGPTLLRKPSESSSGKKHSAAAASADHDGNHDSAEALDGTRVHR